MSTVVTATTGRETGSGPSRRLRVEGQLPGVVYGRGTDPIPVDVVYTELRDALKGAAGLNTIFTLDVDGSQEQVIVRDIQRDPIKRTVIHADFMRVSEDTKVTVVIPISLVGKSEALSDAGGIVEQKMHSIKVFCPPSKIPNEIEVDVSIMALDRRLSVADLNLPEGVSTKVGDNITVAAPVVPRGALEAEEEEGEEGEEGAEGEASEAAAAEGGEE